MVNPSFGKVTSSSFAVITGSVSSSIEISSSTTGISSTTGSGVGISSSIEISSSTTGISSTTGSGGVSCTGGGGVGAVGGGEKDISFFGASSFFGVERVPITNWSAFSLMAAEFRNSLSNSSYISSEILAVGLLSI